MSQTKAQLVSGTTAQDLTVDNINTTSINSGQTSGRKNLVINGAMNIAQRGTSSTTHNVYLLDRFHQEFSGTDESPTYAQVDVASGTDPYASGFRKAYKVTNGNQTSGAGASDYIQIDYRFEAQDIAKSGWNYTSSSSNITVSFWVKSSVSKDFQIDFRTFDGTAQSFQFETPTLTADTWTKVTKTIPGNSSLQFDNDTNIGLILFIFPYIGTTYTDASNTLNAWQTASASTYGVVDGTSWYTTNDATFEITGVQVEVGSTATDFEHRSFTDELALCQRYCCKWHTNGATTNNHSRFAPGYYNTTSQGALFFNHPVPMRATDGRTLTHNIGNIESFTGGGASNTLALMGDGNSNMITAIVVSLSSVTQYNMYLGRIAGAQTDWYLIVANEL